MSAQLFFFFFAFLALWDSLRQLVVLKYLSDTSVTNFFQRRSLLNIFFLSVDHCFLCMLCDFVVAVVLVEPWTFESNNV